MPFEKVGVKKQDLPDWAKDLFDRKGNLKNYLPSLDEEPKEIPTPPLHPGETSLDINEHRERGDFDVESLGEQYYPSQYNQQMNLPYGYEREMTVDEVIDSHPMLRNAPRDFAEEYVKQHQFSPYRHLNTKDSRKSPFQLNLQRLTEFEDYDDWNEFDKDEYGRGHDFDLPSFLNIPWNEKTAFTRSEPMDIAWRLLKTPLLPESIKQVSDNRVEAQFQDPKTNQVFPMIAEKDPKFRTMNVGIYPNQPGQNLGAPSGLDAMDMADKDINEDVKEMLGLGLSNAELTETNEDGPYYESDMTWTDPERRRRGYASALYNLVNQLGERKVRPSANQSDEGKQLWRKRMLPKGEPMDLAWQLLKEEM